MSFSKVINLQSNRLDIIRQDLLRDVFGQFWRMCKSDLLFGRQFLIRHIDGKYRNATVLLVDLIISVHN